MTDPGWNIPDLRHLPHSRRRWHDGLPFLAMCCAAAALVYAFAVLVFSLN